MSDKKLKQFFLSKNYNTHLNDEVDYETLLDHGKPSQLDKIIFLYNYINQN